MPTPERIWTRRRVAIAAAVIVALVLVAALLASRREASAPGAQPPAPDAPRPLQIDTPPLPVPPPPLSRADLIAIGARAASAYATGQPGDPRDASLVGRNFLVSLPFGCNGPSKSAAGPHWAHDAKRGVITLVAHPETWTETSWVRALAGDRTLDAVEGFWIPRPWILSEDCPPASALEPGAAPVGQGEQTLGLAQFFAPGSSRVLQRGARPYEFVGKAPTDQSPLAPKGYRLVLAGRIAGFSPAEPARCRVESAGRRPVCLVAVTFDRVAFEDPISGKTLAEWRMN